MTACETGPNPKLIMSPVQLIHSVVSDSLRCHESQHVRPPCPSPTPRVYSNPCPSSWWCHPTISSSVVPFSHLQSSPASGSFPMNRFFASGGQNIGVSASASVLPMSIQDWFPLGLTGGSPCSPRDSQESSPTPQSKSINSSVLSFLCSPTRTSIHELNKLAPLKSFNSEQPISCSVTEALVINYSPLLGRTLGFCDGSDSKESACNVRDLGSIPGSGRSPGEGNGNPL